MPTDYQIPDEEDWMMYHDFSRDTIVSSFADFSNQKDDYYKKKSSGWKVCDDKQIREQYFFMKGDKGTPTEHIKTCTHHLRLKNVCLISPKGSKKWFKNILCLTHLDPTKKANLTFNIVVEFMADDQFDTGFCNVTEEQTEEEEVHEDPI